MDADDVMLPNRIEVQFLFMENLPHIAILGGYMSYIGRTATTEGRTGHEVTLNMLLNGNVIAHPTVMIRKEDLQKHHLLYDSEYIYVEDYNLWVDALKAGLRIFNMPDVLINYRLSDTQVTHLFHNEQAQNAQRVQQKIANVIYSDVRNEPTINPCPVKEGNQLTVIIPFLNEKEEVGNTLHSIRKSVNDEVEIIVINDGSDDGWDYSSEVAPFRATYVVNKHRIGVAANRDYGISICRTPYFLLLDAHMRFYDGEWAERLLSLLKKNDRVLLCCQTRFLSKDLCGNITVSEQLPTTFGALTPFNPNNFWPDIDWNYHELQPKDKIEPIANVLGAGYATSKRYWEYLHGLQGLRSYGSDEAFISFKVWMEGGKCLLVKDVVIGHIYRQVSPYKHYVVEEVYNNLLISHLLLPQSWRCRSMAWAYRKDAGLYEKGIQMLNWNKSFVKEQKAYMSSICSVPFEEVLQMHKKRITSSNEQKKFKDISKEVHEYLLKHPVQNIGLYEGQAGHLLWYCLYYKEKIQDEAIFSSIQVLCESIRKAVLSHTLLWTFSQGVSGIGWVLIFLHIQSLLKEHPMDILSKIDKQLQVIDVEKIPVSCIDDGVGGILAYAVMRLKTGNPQWDNDFSDKLQEAALRVLSVQSDLPSTYYAMSYLDILKNGAEVEDFRPRINDWLKAGQHLPSNRRYWKPVLMDGCIGAVINMLNF